MNIKKKTKIINLIKRLLVCAKIIININNEKTKFEKNLHKCLFICLNYKYKYILRLKRTNEKEYVSLMYKYDYKLRCKAHSNMKSKRDKPV